MGRLPQSVVVSAALHVGAVAWVATQDIDLEHRGAPPAVTTTVIELVDPAAIPPMTVELPADDATAVTPADPASPPRSERSTPRASIATTTRAPATTTSGASATSTEPGTAPGTAIEPRSGERSKYFDMRRGERVDLTLPATRDDLDRAPAGTAPQSGSGSSGKLAPDGTGHKSDEGSFVAKVDRDGRVKLHDRPDVSIRIAVPTPKQIGRGIAEWYESDKGPDGKRGKRTLENEISGTVDQATTGCGGVRDNACSPDRTPTYIVPVFRGNLSPTDWLMRRTVGDPYASKKRAYLDATREERAQLRVEHRARQLRETAVIVRESLHRAWRSTTNVAARKQLLFELWDEIVEPAADDAVLAEAARVARAQVIGFIRARLPQRDKDAYTTEEIAALNAKRQSNETFSPYE